MTTEAGGNGAAKDRNGVKFQRVAHHHSHEAQDLASGRTTLLSRRNRRGSWRQVGHNPERFPAAPAETCESRDPASSTSRVPPTVEGSPLHFLGPGRCNVQFGFGLPATRSLQLVQDTGGTTPTSWSRALGMTTSTDQKEPVLNGQNHDDLSELDGGERGGFSPMSTPHQHRWELEICDGILYMIQNTRFLLFSSPLFISFHSCLRCLATT